VHLEQALRLSDRLGGHLVTGHIDDIGTISKRQNVGVGFDLTIEAPQQLQDLLVEKGSIAVDGVSLTVARVEGNAFGVMIIPHTAEQTLLGGYGPGQKVNLEGDIIGKYVKHMLRRDISDSSRDSRIGDLLKDWGPKG